MNKPARDPQLAENLAQAAAIKQHMTELLRELEETATGRTIGQPGAWRHHPRAWADQNPLAPDPAASQPT